MDNCEKTKFENNSFDIVYGTGILHHLQFNKCLDEIHRILKPNGSIVFVEPLGTNPLITYEDLHLVLDQKTTSREKRFDT